MQLRRNPSSRQLERGTSFPVPFISLIDSFWATNKWWDDMPNASDICNSSCKSSAFLLNNINSSFSKLQRLGFEVFGVCSDYVFEVKKQHDQLRLHFFLLSCPENQLPARLGVHGIADITVSSGSSVGYPGGTVQPCIIATTRHKIIYSWACEDRTSLFGNFVSDKWSDVDELIQCLEHELTNDGFPRLTPTAGNSTEGDDSIFSYFGCFIPKL